MLQPDFDRMMRSCVNTFGQTVRYTRGGVSSVIPMAVFDANYELISMGAEGPEVVSTGPRIGVHTKDLPFAPKPGDSVELVRTGQKFVVWKQEPDSGSGVQLYLHADRDDPEADSDD